MKISITEQQSFFIWYGKFEKFVYPTRQVKPIWIQAVFCSCITAASGQQASTAVARLGRQGLRWCVYTQANSMQSRQPRQCSEFYHLAQSWDITQPVLSRVQCVYKAVTSRFTQYTYLYRYAVLKMYTLNNPGDKATVQNRTTVYM